MTNRHPLRLKPARNSIDFTLEVIEATEHVEGDVVECGSYQGDGLITAAAYLDHIGSKRKIVGYDSFLGLHPTGADGTQERHLFTDTGAKLVLDRIARYGMARRATVIEGEFTETLPHHATPISVLILDCDLYESYRTALDHLWRWLSPGGVVVLDEYGRPTKWPGARMAVDEFLIGRPETVEYAWWFPYPEAPRWYIRKPGAEVRFV